MSLEDLYDKDGNPITQKQWSEMFNDNSMFQTVVSHPLYECRVSTVWLGMDHNWGPDGPPLIFETMIFGGPYDQDMDRYSTKEQAEEGHNYIVQVLRDEYARRS